MHVFSMSGLRTYIRGGKIWSGRTYIRGGRKRPVGAQLQVLYCMHIFDVRTYIRGGLKRPMGAQFQVWIFIVHPGPISGMDIFVDPVLHAETAMRKRPMGAEFQVWILLIKTSGRGLHGTGTQRSVYMYAIVVFIYFVRFFMSWEFFIFRDTR